MAVVDLEGHALPLVADSGLGAVVASLDGWSPPLVLVVGLPVCSWALQGRAMPLSLTGGGLQSEASLSGRASVVVADTCRVVVQVRPAYGPNLKIVYQPRIGGGCAITVFGKPNSMVYATLVGIADDGYETEPYGRLVRAFVATDSKGRAVLHYRASVNPEHAGKRDRLIVYA